MNKSIENIVLLMMYGIHTYTNQSYLLNHVDRSATHAVSVIIQVKKKI